MAALMPSRRNKCSKDAFTVLVPAPEEPVTAMTGCLTDMLQISSKDNDDSSPMDPVAHGTRRRDDVRSWSADGSRWYGSARHRLGDRPDRFVMGRILQKKSARFIRRRRRRPIGRACPGPAPDVIIAAWRESRMRLARATACLSLLAGLLLVAGCAVTRVDGGHPRVSEDSAAATVYFIRPFTERYMGFADNALAVEADRTSLLTLGKGEYTLARLQPGPVFLTARSDTSWGASHQIREMTREQRFELTPGGTYFIVFRPFDGEFRGVHFEMASVGREEAQTLGRHLRAAGAARSAPLDEL
jgi:hypothetical protein